MFKEEDKLVAHIADGNKIKAGDEVSPGYRGELMRLMAIFVDSELAGAAGFADCINQAPGLRERSTAARIVSEKFAHAESVLALMEAFGINPTLYMRAYAWNSRLDRAVNLGSRRVAGDKRLNIFHYPLQGWTDAVTMNLLMGSASAVQLRQLAKCSYQPLADVMGDIIAKEGEHAQTGENGLEQAIERDETPLFAQASVAYWYPRVKDTFGRADSASADKLKKYGLRNADNAELSADWEGQIKDRLERLGLDVPEED